MTRSGSAGCNCFSGNDPRTRRTSPPARNCWVRYAHDPIEVSSGTTFYFVTGGFDAALDRARDAAGNRDIRITGGASTVRQAFAAGVIDDIHLDIIPVALGRGETIFEVPQASALVQLEVTHSSTCTHIHYRVG
jgi:dihydrofolate reductase